MKNRFRFCQSCKFLILTLMMLLNLAFPSGSQAADATVTYDTNAEFNAFTKTNITVATLNSPTSHDTIGKKDGQKTGNAVTGLIMANTITKFQVYIEAGLQYGDHKITVNYSTNGGTSWSGDILTLIDSGLPMNGSPPYVIRTSTSAWQNVTVNPDNLKFRFNFSSGNNNDTPVIRIATITYTTIPVISSVSFTPSSGAIKAGDFISMNISADYAGYTAGAISINGKAIDGGSFTDNGDKSYTVKYTVASGDTNRIDVTIPVSVVLTDSNANSNVAFTTSPAAASSPDIDTVAPNAFTLSTPANNTWVTTATPMLTSGAATDDGTGLHVTTPYEFFIDGASAGTSTTTSYTTGSLAEGDHTWYVVAKDKPGNTRQSTATWTVRVDTIPPTIQATTLTLPNGGEFMNGVDGPYDIKWNSADITDATSGLKANPITIYYWNGGTSQWVQIATNQANDGIYSWTPPAMDRKDVKIKIEAADVAGNLSSDESDAVFTIDTVRPTVTQAFSIDSNGDGVVDGLEIEFSEPVKDSTIVLASYTMDESGQTVWDSFSASSTRVRHITDADIADDKYVSFSIAFPSNITTTGVMQYRISAGGVKDIAGNPINVVAATAATDDAPPVIKTVETEDSNLDGKIDRLKITMSESVNDASYADVGSSATTEGFGTTGLGDLVTTAMTTGAADDNVFYLPVTVGGAYNTGVTGNFKTNGDAPENYLFDWKFTSTTAFNQPHRIAFDPAGNIFVTDYAGDRKSVV